jgi:hypothetical protein
MRDTKTIFATFTTSAFSKRIWSITRTSCKGRSLSAGNAAALRKARTISVSLKNSSLPVKTIHPGQRNPSGVDFVYPENLQQGEQP